MASLEKISEYVKVHPGMKAREIARHLGMARKSVNSILYRNGNLFIKDENHNWALKDADTQAQPNEPSEPQLSETIHVENIDLANRLKASLEENPNQRITALSSSLKVKRQTISRTLNSFPDIFSKNSDREWNILPESEKSSSSHDLETRTEIAIPAETEVLAPTDYKETLPASPRSIIEAKLDRNILVLAPPGTGKTHTLIERLIHTLSNSDRNTDPGELLVLSFSRPVVGEIKERLASAIREGAPDRLRYVRVRTFDSYATWLLHDGDYDLSAKNYDDRIELLTRNLREQTLVQSTNRIGKTRFLFVDEIQDLVGIRADMVFELVKRVLASNGAVNLLGDPNQAITEYQIRNDSIDSSEFIEKVKKLLLGNLDELELDQYYRFETKEMQSLVKNAKRIMDDTEISPTEKIEQITKLLPILDQNKFVELVDEGEISALLCRSNAEVFMSKKWFENRDIEHTVNLGSTGRPWAPWIGAILMQFNQSKISIQTLENRIQELETGPISCTSQEMKDLLHRENLIRGKVIDLSELSRKVSHTSPAAKPRVAGNRLELSTIHKAKGLGYDTVVIKEPSQHNNVTDEEARVLYVALTRAKRNLYLLSKDSSPFNQRARRQNNSLRHRYNDEENKKYLQILGLQDFDLETLFFDENGFVNVESLEAYIGSYKLKPNLLIKPEKHLEENKHNYALYASLPNEALRLCSASDSFNKDLNRMSWGNNFNDNGCLMTIGNEYGYQTVTHPLSSAIIDRHLGPAGIMVFPLLQGFFPLLRAN